MRGVAEERTLKLYFMVKKWQNRKSSFGILISALYRYQNRKTLKGHIDTLTHKEVFLLGRLFPVTSLELVGHKFFVFTD